MLVKEINTELLNSFTAKETVPVFSSFNWVKLFSEKLLLLGIFEEEDKLIGYCYFFSAKKNNLSYLINTPYTPHCGLHYLNPSKNKSKKTSFDKKVMTHLAEYIEAHKFHFVDFSIPSTYVDTQAFYWKKFSVNTRYTYHLDLSPTEEELYANISSEKRKSLKRAEKDQLSTVLCTDYDEIKKLVTKTFDRKQKKINEALLDKILTKFAEPQNCFAFITKDGTKPIACAFCVYDLYCCYYLFGGYDPQNRHHGAGVSSMWNCILYAKRKGIKTFDFEGSMLPEVEKYFREFGGALIPYYTIQKASLPVKIGLGLIKRKAF